MAKILNKFFRKRTGGKEKRQLDRSEVLASPESLDHLVTASTSHEQANIFDLPQFTVGCSQSIGRVREHNEDAIFSLTSLTADNREVDPLGLFIVADGMGGHKLGEVASHLAVRAVAAHIIQKVILSLLMHEPASLDTGIHEILSESVLAAHKLITSNASGSGTTLTALLIVSQRMSIAHVGDSRAYAISPDGEVRVLTRDHSLVKRMIELGHLTEEEALSHPQRNVLYRALGQGDPLEPDIISLPLPSAGYLLLCSDGLWGVVSQDEIIRIVLENPYPPLACQLLINAANLAGGPDNISAILVRLPDH